MVKCVRGLNDIFRLRMYRRYRPLYTIKQDPRAWWLYAISCQYPERPPAICKPKPTWESCLEHARQNVQYVKLYTKILATPVIALSPESKNLKDAVEWQRDYDQLKLLREVYLRKV